MTEVVNYPAIEDLIPHGLPIQALEEMIEWEPGRAVCRLKIRPHSSFVRGGKVPSAVCLEYMAQGAAACLGYAAHREGGRVRVGMIVGVRKMELNQSHVVVGDELRVTAQRVHGMEDVSTFRGETSVGAQIVATAHITLVHPQKPPST